MNYRHQFHAGNFADVAKHVLLTQLIRALQQKPKGFLYLDTHAGRGSYDLRAAAAGDSRERTPEWPEGVGRLWNRTDAPPVVTQYLGLAKAFDERRGNLETMPRFYPGSPWIARMLARPQDRLVVCEKHPAEADALRADLSGVDAGLPPVSVQETDGYVAIRAMLPPQERRALVLVDPPYEAQDEFAQAVAALEPGLDRLPHGVFALWYPLTERARVREFHAALTARSLPPTLVAELAIAGDDSLLKMKGCGLVVINPPWQFDRLASTELTYLTDVLAQEPGAGSRVTWLVPES